MKKALKWIGIGLAALLAVVILSAAGLSTSTSRRLNKVYDIQVEAVQVPTGADALAEGKRLAAIYCSGCHGDNLEGTDFFDDPAIGVTDAPNLTAGDGGIGGETSTEDWVRAIRHGVGQDGKALFIMPAKDFYFLSDEDLGQIIAYLQSAPPVDNQANDFSTKLMGRILVSVGAFGDVFNAETIEHTAPRPSAPAPAVSAAYGDYLVQTIGCRTCHGPQLSGGKDPNPGAPPGPNLTPGGNLANWSASDFITTFRTRQSKWMPFETLRNMSDAELEAVYLYLQSLPALETTVE